MYECMRGASSSIILININVHNKNRELYFSIQVSMCNNVYIAIGWRENENLRNLKRQVRNACASSSKF